LEALMDNPRRQPAKTKRRLAWAAYLALTDAARWLEAQLRTPLDVFGLSREEFRLMVLLHRDGPLKLSEAEAKLGAAGKACTRQFSGRKTLAGCAGVRLICPPRR
jgi:hypothetical protein